MRSMPRLALIILSSLILAGCVIPIPFPKGLLVNVEDHGKSGSRMEEKLGAIEVRLQGLEERLEALDKARAQE